MKIRVRLRLYQHSKEVFIFELHKRKGCAPA